MILLPLMLGLFWSTFIEQEYFVGFVLGAFASFLSGAVVLFGFLLKEFASRPVASALLIIACSIIGIVFLLIAGVVVTVAFYGGTEEAFWGMTVIFLLVAPVAFLIGVVFAVSRFVKERRAIRGVVR